MPVFWDVALDSLVDIDRRFRGAYRLHQGDDYAARDKVELDTGASRTRQIPCQHRFFKELQLISCTFCVP
jgi:hypothetical protein